MSLYRTWRPLTFEDLVGQDAVVKTLTTALETGRLAHAYLFSGPRGSGKTSAAKILARCIDCVIGPTAHPDNTCENCRAILDGTALDVLEIDAASNRGIDEIRALREAVKFAPSTMRSKVYIIDEAHMLTKEGANAFLKTLEEPPEWATFILATTAPEALPPTILSRCQRYAFRRIAIPTMIERMRQIADAEGIAIDDAALGAIAYRADGGLRDALTMLEQVAAFANGSVDATVVDAAFGQTGREFARGLRDAALDGDAAEALRIIDAASDAGADMTGLIRSTIAEFRHLLVARVNPELLARDLAEDDARVVRERAEATPQARLVRALRLLADALGAARGSGNARLELESAVLRFVLQGEDPTLDALAARVAALEGGGAAQAAAPSGAIGAALRQAQGDTRQPARENQPLRESAQPARESAQPARENQPLRESAQPARESAQPARESAQQVRESGQPVHESSEPVGSGQPVRGGSQPMPEAKGAGAAAEPAAATPRPRSRHPEPVEGPPPSRQSREPAKPAAVPSMELSLQKLRTLWQSIRTRAESAKGSLRAGLSRATVAALDGDTLTLRVPDTVTAEMLKRDIAAVKKAIADVTGRALDVRVAVASGAPPETGVADDDGEDEPDDLMRYALEKLP